MATSPGSKPRKHPCSQCGKSNAVGTARLCPTCRRLNTKASRRRAHHKAIEAKYGISGEEYDALYEAQGGRCAICRTSTGKAKMLAVDHDHKTGIVRGLLCGSCNHRLLGAAHDGTEILVRAIEYLENPPAPMVLERLRNGSQETGTGAGH